MRRDRFSRQRRSAVNDQVKNGKNEKRTLSAAFFPPIFLSSLFLYMTPFYLPADMSSASPFWIFFVGALITGFLAVQKGETASPSASFLLWVGPSLFFPIIIPFPYNFFSFFILAAMGLFFCSGRVSIAGRTASVLFILGVSLLVQTAVLPLLIRLLARVHEIPLLNMIAYPVVSFLGVKASITNGIITFPFYEGAMEFPGTLEKSGFFTFILAFAGSGATLFFTGAGWIGWFRLFVVSIGYWIVRYIVMILVFVQVRQTEIFYQPMAVILSYLPMALLLGVWLPVSPGLASLMKRMARPLHFSRRDAASLIAWIMAFFSLMGLFGFHDPGKKKGGRILIDEKHSDWEWSMRKFDTSWYGSQSTYNYYSMAAYLKSFYPVDHHTDGELTPALLSQWDILILKTPTRSFSEREIDAIESFVEKGGGLFLIGDHTNVFGMSYYLNPVAKRFGLFFHYDSTYDLDSGKLTYYEKPLLFPHPAVMHVPYFLFATSCTLGAPFDGEDIMTGYGLRSRLLSYSGRAFFEDKPLQDYEFGLFLQAEGVKKGKGRVVAFSDSTCFSNFYMFIPGKPELVLGITEWLNRENRFGDLWYPLLLLMIGCGITGWFWADKNGDRSLIFGGLAVLPGTLLGFIFFSWLTEAIYPPPEPHTPFKTIFFEREYSDFSLPLKELAEHDPKNYHTFYVWTQRLDFTPKLEEKIADCFEKKDGFLILINPATPFSEEVIKQAVSFVEGGGKLLILDAPQNQGMTSQPLLASFGMGMARRVISKAELIDRAGLPIGLTVMSGTVEGGEPCLRTRDNQTVFAVKRFGKGRIGVMADSHMFSNQVMGGTQMTPTQKQLDIYKVMFYVLRVMESG